MNPITKHPEYYHQTYDVFQEVSQEEQIDIDILEKKVPAVLQKVWKDRGLSKGSAPKQFSILSVGGATGVVDLPILSAVANHFSESSKKANIHNEVVDPCGKSLAKYRALAGSLPEHLQRKAIINFEFLEKTYESYVDEEDKVAARFDIVHFLHCFYYFPKGQQAPLLEHAFTEQLKETGAILLIMVSNDSVLNAIRWHAVNRYNDTMKADVYTTSEDVIAMAKKNKWNFEVFRTDSLFDATEVFEDSERGNLLLDFLTHYRDFRATASAERVASNLEVIKNFSFLDKDGRWKSKFGNELIVIYKGLAQ